MARTTAVLILALWTVVARAEEKSGLHAPWVTCFDSTGKFAGPKEVRTETLSSAGGVYRAYAQIQAAASGPLGCENTVRLFVSSNGAPFTPVFTQTPSITNGTANSLGPVAWSPNGRWLAVEFGFWFYASDGGSLGLLLYDSQTRTASTPDVVKQIESALGKHCSLGLRSVVGFDPRNRVVLRVADWWDAEGLRESSCIKETADWLLDPATGGVQPLQPRGPTVCRYFLPAASR